MSGGGLLDGPWTRESSVVVSADAPSMAVFPVVDRRLRYKC
jgi:hypothetical protein